MCVCVCVSSRGGEVCPRSRKGLCVCVCVRVCVCVCVCVAVEGRCVPISPTSYIHRCANLQISANLQIHNIYVHIFNTYGCHMGWTS